MDLLNGPNIMPILKYILTFGFLIYFVITLMKSSEDPLSLTTGYNNYLFPLVVGLIFLIPTVFLGKE